MAEALLQQVDGCSLEEYEGKESVYMGHSVPMRSKITIPIHVMAPGSVMEYAMESKFYDISFGITAKWEEGVTIVKVRHKMECLFFW